MDNSERVKLSEEVNEIIESRFDSINRYYRSIREIYQNFYDWPELDPLRHEICLCIMFGLCQASITLTNHLLESLLKYSLIINHGNKTKQPDKADKGGGISALTERYSDGIEIYGKMMLSSSINAAKRNGLISKQQKQELHAFRENFRNAYGHADKEKTFGKSTMPVTALKLDNDKIVHDEEKDVEIANFLIGQSLVQIEISNRNAVPYFQYIDNLVREIRVKLFGERE